MKFQFKKRENPIMVGSELSFDMKERNTFSAEWNAAMSGQPQPYAFLRKRQRMCGSEYGTP